MGKSISSELCALLKSHRFNYSNEKDLQDGVEAVLRKASYPYERERVLGSAGVIDFLVMGFLGIEIKIKGSPTLVARQLLRYAERDEISEIFLVTGRTRLGKLPEKLNGKPVTVITMWTTFL